MQVAHQLRQSEIHTALRLLGADRYDLLLPETHHLAQLLRAGEIPIGAIYGKYHADTVPHAGRGLLVTTNRRLMLIDKKPLFLQFDDIPFDMVSGVQYRRGFGIEIVILNTRMGNITMRTLNAQCAQRFVQTVEDMLMVRDAELQYP